MSTFETHEAFIEAVIGALTPQRLAQAREIVLVDPDFEGWPLDDPRLLDPLTDFARLPGRRLQLLARRYDKVLREHPRFVAWRRTWGHAIEARVYEEVTPVVPSLLLVDRRWALQILVRDTWHGQVWSEPARAYRCWESADALLQRGEPGFAQTTLGL